jgi:hypothetical protein
MADQAATFMVEDAQLVFKNFSGREGPYNREGDRQFAVVLAHDVAEQLLADGWNVKYFKNRDDEEGSDPPDPYMPVFVRFDIKPPKIVLITSSGRTVLNESTVSMVDHVDIRTCDLIARGYDWSIQATGKTGRKAYLQSLYITVEEDALDLKYGSE